MEESRNLADVKIYIVYNQNYKDALREQAPLLDRNGRIRTRERQGSDSSRFPPRNDNPTSKSG